MYRVLIVTHLKTSRTVEKQATGAARIFELVDLGCPFSARKTGMSFLFAVFCADPEGAQLGLAQKPAGSWVKGHEIVLGWGLGHDFSQQVDACVQAV